VATNETGSYQRAVSLRNHGKSAEGEMIAWGWNSRLDNLQAAILDHRLSSYPDVIGRRRSIAARYQERLADLDELILPPAPGADPRRFDVFQNYELEAESRDALRRYLETRGIGTLIPWGGKAVHQWERLGLQVKLPRTEKLFEKLLLLPLNLSLSGDDINFIADAVRAFYRR
jgi:dTDP-4-amino-4,6-dideoxygalactose transaminase